MRKWRWSFLKIGPAEGQRTGVEEFLRRGVVDRRWNSDDLGAFSASASVVDTEGMHTVNGIRVLRTS